MGSKKYKNLLAFVLLSLSILLVYDLFFEVGSRQEITSDRNFPRVYRFILLLIYSFYIITLKVAVKLRFNGLLKVIYGIIIFNIIIGDDISLSMLTSLSKVLFFFFTYFFFYKVFSIIPTTSIKYLKKFVLFSVLSLSSFMIISRLGNVNEMTKIYGDNNSYILISFLPLIFLLNFKRKNILFLLLFIAIFLSFKRGAMIATVIASTPILFYNPTIKNRGLKKMKKFSFFIFTMILISYIFNAFNEIILERISDISLDDTSNIGSGRGMIYSYILEDFWASTSIFTLLFGHGFESVQLLMQKKIGGGLMAHSDFLNTLYSYGLLGLSLLSWFIIHQAKIVLRLFKQKSQYWLPYFMVFIIFLLKAFYSGNFEQMNFSYLLICYAILNALLVNQKKLISHPQ